MSGIFGAIGREYNCGQDLFYGTDYHSHLGTQYGGLAVLSDGFFRQIHNISQSQFKSKFFDDYHRIRGSKGIGVISAMEEQPIYLNSKHGPFCIVTNGIIENADRLAADLLNRGISFSEMTNGRVNMTELVAKLINGGKDVVDGIEKVFEVIEGSCSLLLLHRDGIYVARDRWGYTPLVIGKRDDVFAVTTETCAFPNSGFEIVSFVKPGEIVLMTEEGLRSQRDGNDEMQICAFYWIYTGFPASTYEGINVEMVRERCGRALARRDNREITADIVSGVPDSGVAHAIGYSIESGVPYRRPLVKYTPGYGRSYTPPSQETRDLVARMKLIPIKDIINGNRIVVCEDSIVRGTQLKNFAIKKLWDNGAREIHVRPACPPLMFPCRFNLSTRTIEELAARRAIRALEGKETKDLAPYLDHTTGRYDAMLKWIADDLGVTTVKYQTIDDMVEAIGLPRERLCLYCWTGECPKDGCPRAKREAAKTPKAVGV